MRNLAKGRTVVVCDGDQTSLAAFCILLAKMGIDPDRMICTSSIKDALDCARDIKPDIVFMDMYVDTEPGYSLCSVLNSANYMNVPVVLMAFPEKGIGPLRGVAMRGRGFITKPVQLLPLQNKLTKIFREVDLERSLSVIDETLDCCSTSKLEDVGHG